MTFKAETLGKAKADISFKKNLEHFVKERPFDTKAVSKLFFQYGVYLDLLEPVPGSVEVITEEDLNTGEMPDKNPLDAMIEKLKSGTASPVILLEDEKKFKIPGANDVVKVDES